MICALLLLGAAVTGTSPQPKMFEPGVISTTLNEFGGVISPDGRELWYSGGVPNYYMEAIYFSRRLPNGRWGPRNLAPFSGHWHDFDPNFSPDGKRILFISDRRTRRGEAKRDYDIWYVDRQAGGWGKPHRFPEPVNSVPDANGQNGREEFASVASDGTIYFAANPRDGRGGMAIYSTRLVNGRYETPVELPKVINFGSFVGEPVIAPDQGFMFFSVAGAPDGLGNWDIYFARREADGQWQAPQHLGGGVNSEERDYSPRLAPDGHTLFFTSERYFGSGGRRLDFPMIRKGMKSLLNGAGNIYTIDVRTLGIDPLRH
jgi:hypothetical protein